LQIPVSGAAVVVSGRTNAQGFVEIETLDTLPAGAVVPAGKPVEVENQSSPEDGTEGSTSSSQVQAPGRTPASNRQSFDITGTVQSVSNNILTINGQSYFLENTKIDGDLQAGVSVEIKGFYGADGRFVITEVKVKNSGSGSGNDGNSTSNPGSNDNSGSGNGGDNSGSGGGDGGGDDGGGDD
jgi:Domain of unknown function (DUF5666)